MDQTRIIKPFPRLPSTRDRVSQLLRPTFVNWLKCHPECKRWRLTFGLRWELTVNCPNVGPPFEGGWNLRSSWSTYDSPYYITLNALQSSLYLHLHLTFLRKKLISELGKITKIYFNKYLICALIISLHVINLL